MQILAFGDSITYGCWDEKGGWVERVKMELNKKALHEKDFWGVIYNLGICGGRTDHLVKRFKSETEQRLDSEEALYFIIAFGANDAAHIQSENRFRISPQYFKDNLAQVINEAKAFSGKVILLTITPVNESQANGIEGDKIRKNEFVEQYNKKIRELGEEENVETIDIYNEYMKQDYSLLLCSDGLHPNSKGHEVISQQVKEYFLSRF